MEIGRSNFSVTDCKVILREMLDTFSQPENANRLQEARVAAGNDMLRSMQNVFPAATQMQMQVIQRYGFLPDGEGLVQFTKAVRVYEEQDQDIRQMNDRLRQILIPPINIQFPVPSLMNHNNGMN